MISHIPITIGTTALAVVFLFAPYCLSATAVQDSALPIIPEGYRAKVEEVLESAGSNGDSLAAAVLELETGEEIEAAAFLLAHLSRVDRVSMTPELLVDNVRLAVKARHEFPWGEGLGDDLFFPYVLSHRVAQEPLEPWRRPFYDELTERVRTCSTATEAALEVNRWCNEYVTYQPTDWRDMGPLTTKKVGLGRCEEEMIFYICAARSVGIPARSCYTPLWGFTDSNHAWVEVWADGSWHYLGACEPAETLDKAWFSSAVLKAGLVLSVGYGATPEGFNEPIYRKGDDYFIVNSTGVYTDTAALDFDLTYPDGSPADSMNIWAAVFSFGGLRPLARVPTDSLGHGSMVFGVTDVVLSAGNDSLGVFRILQIRPDMDRLITLRLSENHLPNCDFWLHHPAKSVPPQEEIKKTEADSLRQVISKLESKIRDSKREQRELVWNPIKPEVTDLLDRFDPQLPKISEGLKDARGNWQELATAIQQCDPGYLDDLTWLLEDMSQKDRWEITGDALLEHLNYAEMTRDFYKKAVPDSLFRQYVLSVIIDREPPLPWRKALYEEVKDLRKKHIPATALKVNTWLMEKEGELEDQTPFRNQPTPIEALKMEGGSKRDLAVLTVGCLRALGVPARMALGSEWVEWYNGKEFVPMYPLEPDKLGNVSKDSKSEQVYREEGTVALTFTEDDSITISPEFETHFTVSKWDEGFYWPDERAGSYQDSTYYLTVEAGDWLLTVGHRKEKQATYVQAIPITVVPKDTVNLTVSFDLPEE
jgi:hypothetical protein